MELVDPYDDRDSAKNRRWKCLNYLTMLLSEGKVQLEDLVRQVENCHPRIPSWDQGLFTTGKRSPRTDKNFGLKNSSVSGRLHTVVYSQSSVPSQTTITKPSSVATGSEIIPRSLHKNPIFKKPTFPCKTQKGFEKGECSSRPSGKKPKIRNFRNVEKPTLPEKIKDRIVKIGGCLESVVFVIEKRLYLTDVSKSHGRLTVPHRQVNNKFLESHEQDELNSGKGIRSALLQPSLEECEITFKSWNSNSTYVLVNNWNRVRRDNGLMVGKTIQLWAFRRNSELCFAILRMDQDNV
ncbi:hypothetical protein OROGR_029316 [Orobanche gracilis]